VCVRKALSLSMIMFISCLVYQYWHKAKKILGLRVISPLLVVKNLLKILNSKKFVKMNKKEKRLRDTQGKTLKRTKLPHPDHFRANLNKKEKRGNVDDAYKFAPQGASSSGTRI